MTKLEFLELTGEYPIDILGNDWKNILIDLTEI